MKMTTKILVMLFIVSILPLSLLSILSVMNIRSKEGNNAIEKMEKLALNGAESLSEFMNPFKDLVGLISVNDYTVESLQKENSKSIEKGIYFFKQVKDSSPYVVNAYVGSEKTGKLYVYPPIDDLPADYNPRTRAWYKNEKVLKGETSISDPYLDVGSKKMVISISKSITSDGKFLGVTALDFNIQSLVDKLLSTKLTELGYTYAINADGIVVLHANEEMLGIDTKENGTFSKFSENKGFYEFKDETGEMNFASYAKSSLGWYVVTVAKSSEVFAQANSQTLMIIFASLITSLIALFIGIFISKKVISNPVRKISTVIKMIGEGNFQIEAEKSSRDEIGEMALTLNGSAKALSEMMKNINEAALQMKNSSNELVSIAEDASVTSEELYERSKSIEGNVENTASSIEEISSGVEEVSASSQNLLRISQNLSVELKNTNNAVKSGQTQLEKQSDMMTQVNQINNNTTKIVEDLSQKSNNVQDIVNTITSIAEQTNLLALNAAIEAARAGEAGKGFAVVADEIRKLAEESKSSSANIASILQEIDNGATHTNEAVIETVEIIRNISEGSVKIVEDFETIFSSMCKVTEMADNMTGAAKEQSIAADEMASSMNLSSKSMLAISEHVKQMNEGVGQQSNASQKINKATEEIQKFSEGLSDQIKSFNF